MALVSVLITARNEPLLANTIQSLFDHANTELEFVIVRDGEGDVDLPPLNTEFTVIRNKESKGIRYATNQAVHAAQGEYLLKVDAHCTFSDNFVSTLLWDYQGKEVLVASRFTLDLSTMQPSPRRVDYYYLSCPWTHPKAFIMQSCPWIGRTEAHPEPKIDDLMCFQGSMWFMSREHWDWMGDLDTEPYTCYTEMHEISLRSWLGGRRVAIDKNVWYTHPGKRVSGYQMNDRVMYHDHEISAYYWTRNSWPRQVHPFGWLVEKFWPLPTEHNHHRIEKYRWPEDWRKYLAD